MPGRPLCSHRPAPRASPIPGASPSPAIARYCRRPRQPGRCSLARGRRPRRPPPARTLLHPPPSHRTQCAERSRLILPTPHAPVALPASVGMPGRPLCSHRPAPRASPVPGAAPSSAIARYCRRPLQPGRCSLARGRRLRRASLVRALLIPPPSRRTQCAGRSRWILSAPRSSPARRCSPAKAAACAALSRPGAVPPQRAVACAAPLSSGRCSSPRHRAGCSAQAGRAGFYPRRAPPRPGAVPPQRPPPAPPSPGRALLIPAPSHRTQCAERSRLILPTPHASVMSAAAPVALPASVGMPDRPLCSRNRVTLLPGPDAAPSPAIAQDAVRRKVTLDFTHAARSGHVRGSSGRAARLSRHAGPPVLPAPRRKIGPLHRCARLSAGKISLHGSVQRAIIVFASGRGAIPHRRSQSANRSRCRLRPNR